MVLGVPVLALFMLVIVIFSIIAGIMMTVSKNILVGTFLLTTGCTLLIYVIHFINLGDKRSWVRFHHMSNRLRQSALGDEII